MSAETRTTGERREGRGQDGRRDAARVHGAARELSVDRSPGRSSEAIAAVAHAAHGDPFAVLGPHEVAPGEWEIRAMLPQALRV